MQKINQLIEMLRDATTPQRVIDQDRSHSEGCPKGTWRYGHSLQGCWKEVPAPPQALRVSHSLFLFLGSAPPFPRSTLSFTFSLEPFPSN